MEIRLQKTGALVLFLLLLLLPSQSMKANPEIMSKETDELMQLLVLHLEGRSDGNPSDNTDEGIAAYHLTGTVSDFETGDASFSEVQAAFKQYAPTFDYQRWFSEKVEQGVYLINEESSE